MCVQTPHVAALQASGRSFVHSGMGGVACYRLRLNGQAELPSHRLNSNQACNAGRASAQCNAGLVVSWPRSCFVRDILKCEAVREEFELCLTITPAGVAGLQAVCPAPKPHNPIGSCKSEEERALTGCGTCVSGMGFNHVQEAVCVTPSEFCAWGISFLVGLSAWVA